MAKKETGLRPEKRDPVVGESLDCAVPRPSGRHSPICDWLRQRLFARCLAGIQPLLQVLQLLLDRIEPLLKPILLFVAHLRHALHAGHHALHSLRRDGQIEVAETFGLTEHLADEGLQVFRQLLEGFASSPTTSHVSLPRFTVT